MASSSSSSSSESKQKDLLFQPTELNHEEYQSLLEQIRNELTIQDCQEELMDAARYNDIDMVRAILQVHPQLPPMPMDNTKQGGGGGGNTPLHMAAANGHVGVMEILLATGAADPSITNAAGNTALHWASQNGQDAAVQMLLKHDAKADVLQRNAFGRSALTEGFTSENTSVVKSLLEHDSATEEKLLMNNSAPVPSSSDGDMGETESTTPRDGVTHEFIFLDTPLRVRELPIARGDDGESILGQSNPSDDTTGLGIWAASLVMAQWMAHLCQKEDRFRPLSSTTISNTTILELGAGCGIPALTIAKMAKPTTSVKVYATDFNPQTVKNLQYNLELNECCCCQTSSYLSDDATSKDDDDCKAATTPAANNANANATAMIMNWQDPSTWPKEPMDYVIGSDLIYQSDMVPLLVQTITSLLKKHSGTFLYCAPETQGRQGHDEFMLLMTENFTCMEQLAPPSYLTNPLESQDDDLCYLHFHELQSSSFKLYEFSWKK